MFHRIQQPVFACDWLHSNNTAAPATATWQLLKAWLDLLFGAFMS